MDKILITGYSGFVGSHLLDNLSFENKSKIFCLKKNTPATNKQEKSIINLFRGNLIKNQGSFF